MAPQPCKSNAAEYPYRESRAEGSSWRGSVERGQTTIQAVEGQVAHQPSVAYRMALEKAGETWRLHTLILDVFPTQPGEAVPTFIYVYDRAAFLAGVIPGAVAATWLSTLAIQIGEDSPDSSAYTVQIPPLQEQVNWQRSPRNTLYDYRRIPWPYTRYELYWPNRTTSVQSPEFLVSDTFPFFPSFQAALFDLVYCGTDAEQRARMSASESCLIRLAHPEAWLEDIHLSSTEVTITVAGTEPENASLEISGLSPIRLKQRIGAERLITCPRPATVPTEWWVVLSRGGDWLDYYHHLASWSAYASEPPHLTTDPPDLRVLIQDWVTRGEGQNIEYKLVIDAAHKERLLQTVAGFANGDGGVILIGVPNTNPSIVGVAGDVDQETVRLTTLIKDNLTAMPPMRPAHCEVEGKQVIVLVVDPGEDVPYGLKPASPTGHPHYYVRLGASNYIAQPHQIKVAVRQRMPATPPYPFS